MRKVICTVFKGLHCAIVWLFDVLCWCKSWNKSSLLKHVIMMLFITLPLRSGEYFASNMIAPKLKFLFTENVQSLKFFAANKFVSWSITCFCSRLGRRFVFDEISPSQCDPFFPSEYDYEILSRSTRTWLTWINHNLCNHRHCCHYRYLKSYEKINFK